MSYRWLSWVVAVLLGLVGAASAQGKDERPAPARPRTARLFVRLVGSRSNAPILPKTRSAWTQDRQVRTGTTGMSDLGFTEYPFCSGVMDFTFVQRHAIYPRLISGAVADLSIVNTADVVADYVYEPDACVWGLTGRELVQTFTATTDELVGATLMVASDVCTLRASIVEGGAGGRQIGPTKTLTSGSSMVWGTAEWEAGQVPLTPGRTYGLRLRREDGKAWTPYLHSTGNAYDGGLLYVDGLPRPGSDLAAWIVEAPPDLRRATVVGADDGGWVHRTKSVTFAPRTPNVRLITLTVCPVSADEIGGGHGELAILVRSADGKVVAGPKRCLSTGPEQREHTAHFLFARGELNVEPGRPYAIEAWPVAHTRKTLPPLRGEDLRPRDMRARVYGEPTPGALPAIYNLKRQFESDSRLRLSWSASPACPVRIDSAGPGVNNGLVVNVPAGQTQITIPKYWAGHEYDIRLTATGPTGLSWRTPLYRIRMPRSDVKPLVQPEYPEQFVTLAPAHRAGAPAHRLLRYLERVEVANGGFEDGLAGWRVTGSDPIAAAGPRKAVGVKRDKAMAGWSMLAGTQRKQVFATSALTRKIPTREGHVYVMSAWAHTSVEGGPRGDTRVRLMVDPAGGADLDGPNAGQWYWTDGRWMRLEHRWRAEAKEATIGLALFRWRDLDRASAYVDGVTVWDLGTGAPGAGDRPAGLAARQPLVLADEKVEADDKIEAHLRAPPGCVITGIGSRAHYDNVTTMWLRVQPLLSGGKLGPVEYLRGGWEADAGLEAAIELPDGYVATGFGARAAPEWDVKSLVVWARPLRADGTLGEEKEFRGGIEPEKGPEKQVRCEAGRVLTSAGLNCMFNDINGIKATSAALVRTATADASKR